MNSLGELENLTKSFLVGRELGAYSELQVGGA